VLSVEYTNSVAALARAHNLKFHIDGARLPNAAVALGVPMRALVEHADSVSVCLSKGLAAPVGSVIAGTKEFITLARKYRKALGGGMRQVGVLAAAGIISLTSMIERLAEDHNNMHLLATELAKVPGLTVDPSTAPTNILFININESLKKALDADKVGLCLFNPLSGQHLPYLCLFGVTVLDEYM
jgi:threonine aldolase